MNPGDHDLLIEIRTIVKMALDRLTSHDQRFEAQEGRISSLESDVKILKRDQENEENDEAKHAAEARHKSNTMWAAITALGSVGLALLTLLVFVLTSKAPG